MTGVLVRAKSGLSSSTEKDLGAFFIAIDPSFFVPIKKFKTEVSKLIKEIKGVRPVVGVDMIYVPGHRGEDEKMRMFKAGVIEVEDRIWKKFEEEYKQYVKVK